MNLFFNLIVSFLVSSKVLGIFILWLDLKDVCYLYIFVNLWYIFYCNKVIKKKEVWEINVRKEKLFIGSIISYLGNLEKLVEFFLKRNMIF